MLRLSGYVVMLSWNTSYYFLHRWIRTYLYLQQAAVKYEEQSLSHSCGRRLFNLQQCKLPTPSDLHNDMIIGSCRKKFGVKFSRNRSKKTISNNYAMTWLRMLKSWLFFFIPFVIYVETVYTTPFC